VCVCVFFYITHHKTECIHVTKLKGDQELCLTNKDVDTALTIGFAFRADSDLMNSGEIATEENVKSMIQIANELTQVYHFCFSL
jgi:hypothetical protein